MISLPAPLLQCSHPMQQKIPLTLLAKYLPFYSLLSIVTSESLPLCSRVLKVAPAFHSCPVNPFFQPNPRDFKAINQNMLFPAKASHFPWNKLQIAVIHFLSLSTLLIVFQPHFQTSFLLLEQTKWFLLNAFIFTLGVCLGGLFISA